MTLLTHTQLPHLFHRGKVRDTYDLGHGYLLMVATDRISAFDVVLPTGVPDKGVILCHLSAFWFRLTAHLLPNHLVALATEPAARPVLREAGFDPLPPDVAARAMVVKKAQRADVECIARGYLAGSAWAEYQRSGTINGERAPRGLLEGSKLPDVLFTPTTKAEAGHDEPLTIAQMEAMVGTELTQTLREKTIQVYRFAEEEAARRGIIIADTKMEFGLLDGQVILIDELLTPDSSRFWDASGYAPGRSQPNFDKQFVRDWLIQSGWDREPPAPALPDEIVAKTQERYLEAYNRLTGRADIP
ncbi:MAG: phosphoribosylaminoimidazolesuccinocarboxamide synthase [Dehalococcoidia bacterium]|nr:phosphoribosylaminoimidazolesuccinocarboxamide synthase [Dehalococcoidia bacterium]